MATNAVYEKLGTPVTWTDTGGDKLMDMGGAAADARVCGAYNDFGASPRPTEYVVELYIDSFASGTVAVGETVDLYLTVSDDGTDFTGAPSAAPTASAEGTVAVNELANMMFVTSAVVVSTTEASNPLRASARVTVTERYIAPVVHNNATGVLASSGDAHTVKITPVYPDIQSAA